MCLHKQVERSLISMGNLSSQLMDARQTYSKLKLQLAEKENEISTIRGMYDVYCVKLLHSIH